MIDRGDAVNLATNMLGKQFPAVTQKGMQTLFRGILSMDTEIMRLERELAEARREIQKLTVTSAEQRAASAERRAAENEADARRYRWLRENDWVTGTTGTVLDIFWHTQEYEHLLGGELDAAIDAALASEAGKVE